MRRSALRAAIALAGCTFIGACQGPVAATPSAGPSRSPMLSVDFASSAGPFDTFDYGTVGAAVRDGALHLTFTDASDITTEQANQQLGDASVQVDATDVGPNPAGRYGVFCRLPSEGTYYQFYIDSSGTAGTRVLGWMTGGSQPPVETKPAAVKTGLGVANRIRADCVGPTFSLWVNDQLISSFSDATTAQGDVGFFATSAKSGSADVAFDNFGVFKP